MLQQCIDRVALVPTGSTKTLLLRTPRTLLTRLQPAQAGADGGAFKPRAFGGGRALLVVMRAVCDAILARAEGSGRGLLSKVTGGIFSAKEEVSRPTRAAAGRDTHTWPQTTATWLTRSRARGRSRRSTWGCWPRSAPARGASRRSSRSPRHAPHEISPKMDFCLQHESWCCTKAGVVRPYSTHLSRSLFLVFTKIEHPAPRPGRGGRVGPRGPLPARVPPRKAQGRRVPPQLVAPLGPPAPRHGRGVST